jgi:uncharacterized protein YuzE
MVYRIKYDEEADVLTIIAAEEGELSHAEELGNIVVHLDREGRPLLIEVLRASEVVPLIVQALAKKEVTVA